LSPADVLSVYEVPSEIGQVEHVQVERVGFNAVKVPVRAQFGLSLVEIALGSCFAIQLFDFVGVDVETVAVVCFLV